MVSLVLAGALCKQTVLIFNFLFLLKWHSNMAFCDLFLNQLSLYVEEKGSCMLYFEIFQTLSFENSWQV